MKRRHQVIAYSSDEVVKREIINVLGTEIKESNLKLRIFPESSRDDQKLFSEGGLTFGYNNLIYGSCDGCWYTENKEWVDGYSKKKYDKKPVLAIEVTDALNRGSSGDAQLQRFHHVLGAVKNGLIGVYYLRKDRAVKIRDDLYGMAYYASHYEKGTYIVTDDLNVIGNILRNYNDKKKLKNIIGTQLEDMKTKFEQNLKKQYQESMKEMANKRSIILLKNDTIKYSARMKRNFTDSSQRAGHIAVGEMYIVKYLFHKFYNERFYYLWPRMTDQDINDLDKTKSKDKEWALLRNEENVKIVTLDELDGLNDDVKSEFLSIKDKPCKGNICKIFNRNMKKVKAGLINGTIKIKVPCS